MDSNEYASTSRRNSVYDFIERKTRVQKRGRNNVQDYFVGPRDLTRHSKLPRALRMHGSVTPKILLRTLGVGIWATFITIISKNVHPINVHPIVTTVLGILVGFSLNLRSVTAYERYMEGRKVWSRLNAVSTSLARSIWVDIEEREGEQQKEDLLAKITCLNMIIAFSVALKHKVRFEPYIQYDDLEDLVGHLETFARYAGTPGEKNYKIGPTRKLGNLLNVAMPNPRSEIKHAKRPIGNLPLEILCYIQAYIHLAMDNGMIKFPPMLAKILDDVQSLDDVLFTADRIVNTPLPIAYTIAISQITWIYVLTIPFQVVKLMGWITIPTATIAAYIILGFAVIGHEIENPFGHEVNDLPLEDYCAQIASDVTIISSKPSPKPDEYFLHPDNKPLYPMSSADLRYWPKMDVDDIHDALRTRALLSRPSMIRKQSKTSCLRQRTSSAGVSTLNGDQEGRKKPGRGGREHKESTSSFSIRWTNPAYPDKSNKDNC